MNITQDIIPSDWKELYPGLSVSITTVAPDNAFLDENGNPFVLPPVPYGGTFLPGSNPTVKDALMVYVHQGGDVFAFYLIPRVYIVRSNVGPTSSYSLSGSPIELAVTESQIRLSSSTFVTTTAFGNTSVPMSVISGSGAYQVVKFFDGTRFGELEVYKDHISLVL